MWYHQAGMLDLVEGPCGACDGEGAVVKASATFAGVTYRVTCRTCGGRGVVRDRSLRPVA